MAFDLEPTRTPTAIGNIVVTLKDARATYEQPYQAAYYAVKVALSDGSVVERKGDLVPHLTPAQREALMGFMDDLRAQAVTEILG